MCLIWALIVRSSPLKSNCTSSSCVRFSTYLFSQKSTTKIISCIEPLLHWSRYLNLLQVRLVRVLVPKLSKYGHIFRTWGLFGCFNSIGGSVYTIIYFVSILHGDMWILNDYLNFMIYKYDENCMSNLSESTNKTTAIMLYHNQIACSIKTFYHKSYDRI